MILDEMDKFILVSILDAHKKKSIITTWDIAKKFQWSPNDKGLFFTDNDENKFYTTKSNFIQRRIERLKEMGIVKIEKEPQNSTKSKKMIKNIYVINGDRIKKSNHQFFNNKTAMALLIKDSSDKWTILEL
jgi:hypothetical protein